MHHSSRTIIRNASFMTIATTLQKVVSFVYFSVIARQLGADSTGVYFFALSVAQLFSIALDIGFSSLIVRETARDEKRGWLYLRYAFGVKIGLALFSIVLVAMLAMSGRFAVPPLYLALAFAAVVADSFQVSWYAFLRGRQLLSYEAIAVVMGQVIVVGLGVAILFTSHSIGGLLVALLVGSFFHALYSYILLYRFEHQWLTPAFGGKIVKEMLTHCWPFALAGVFGKLFSYTDTVFLGLVHSTQLVGHYSVPYKLTYSFQFLPLAVIATLYPAMSSLHGKDADGLRHMLSESLRLIVVAGGAIAFGIVATAPQLVSLFYGASYAPAIPIVETLPLLIMILFAQYPIGAFLNGSNLQRFQTFAMGVAMVVNVLLNIVLIPRYQMMGAVVAAFSSNSILLGLGMWKSWKVIGFDIRKFLGEVVRVIGAGIMMTIVVRSLVARTPLLLAMVIGAIVFVVFSLALHVLRREDVSRVFKALR